METHRADERRIARRHGKAGRERAGGRLSAGRAGPGAPDRETLIPATDGFTAAPPAKLAVQHVSKGFRTPRASVHPLDNASPHVDAGEVGCPLGPRGCGK